MVPCSVKELMRECDQAVVVETMPLREAAERLVVNNLCTLIATAADHTMAGLIPEAAIIRQLMSNHDRDQTVEGVVSRHVESVRAQTDIAAVLHLFRSSCHAVIPVVADDHQVVGLLHRADVVRFLLAETASHSSQARSAKSGPHFADRDEQTVKPADTDDDASAR